MWWQSLEKNVHASKNFRFQQKIKYKDSVDYKSGIWEGHYTVQFWKMINNLENKKFGEELK